MATRPYQFVGAMLKAQHSIRNTIGTDVLSADKQTYNVNLQLLALLAMTLKILQDLRPDIVTDAALQQRLIEAIDTGPNGDKSGWPGWIVLQVAPDDLDRYGATEADDVPTLRAKIDAYNAGNV